MQARILRRGWWAILLGILIGGAAGIAMHGATPVSYSATTQVILVPENGQSTGDQAAAATMARDMAPSYADMVTSPAVLGPVIDDLALSSSVSSLGSQVAGSVDLNKVIVRITGTQPKPDRAALLTDAVADQFASELSKLLPVTQNGERALRAVVVAPAEVPATPSSTSLKVWGAMGAFGGLLFGLVLAVLVDLLWGRRDARRSTATGARRQGR